MKIQITTDNLSIEAELYDTPTAKAIAKILPIRGTVNRWGGEIYFPIDVSAELEADARDVLQPGELGFWPTGNAFCIFFGATPASNADECRTASEVNVFGKIPGDLASLWQISNNADILIKEK